MFQSFENVSDSTKGAARVAKLRAAMADESLDGFLVPRADEYQGEYVPACAERLYWLTGFSGSAGYAAVLTKTAGLFVDGRYTLQARAQCDAAVFEFLGIPADRLSTWLGEKLDEGARVGYDPRLHVAREIERLEQALERKGIAVVPVDANLIDRVWDDRPAPPQNPVQLHGLDYAGRLAEEKVADLQEQLRDAGQDAVVLTLPDSIAWLLNIRGADLGHTPVTLAFAIAHADAPPELFVDDAKVTGNVRQALEGLCTLRAPGDIEASLNALSGRTVRVDPNTAGIWFFQRLDDADATIVREADPVLHSKARKNATEIDGNRRAHIRDGAAMVRFLCWLEGAAAGGDLNEIAAAQKLEEFRAATGELKDISFDTISGAGPHSALPHYRVTEATDRKLAPGEIYLVDSGGQYLDGTTDITRTVAIGAPDDDMRRCNTLVLKGHIAIATARFPKGTRGVDLDPFARAALWSAGLDFDHGTGHGIGSYLSVHEGPASISKRGMVALEPGMILSNEPGYYREDAFGIRIENLVLVTEPEPVDGGERDMMAFETLSFVPLDKTLIDPAALSDAELAWVNAYHAEVREKIAPELDGDALTWLEAATVAVSR
ncbi:MAG: aminopeptidase P family protein [Hyphomicrobiaceae bacterium]